MTTSTETQLVEKVNLLITRNYDAEYGYKTAAEDIEHKGFRDFLYEYSDQRYRFGHQLKDILAKHDGEPDKGTSLKGDFHRAFLELKATFSGDRDVAIIEECIRGEEKTLEDYESVISEEDALDNDDRQTLIAQRNKVMWAIETLKELKVSLEKESE